jgi:hypothetical protein
MNADMVIRSGIIENGCVIRTSHFTVGGCPQDHFSRRVRLPWCNRQSAGTMLAHGYMISLMTKHADKFEATRIVTETIQEFDPKDQAMIFRWVAETLGLPEPFHGPGNAPGRSFSAAPEPASDAVSAVVSARDIQSFVRAKNPRSDVQFAATVAYYYQFVAPESERKTNISESDLVDACRKAGRERPQKPYFTLNNAFHAGLLDRPEKGSFSLNAVGENLVALTLPGTRKGEESSATNGRKKPRKAAAHRKTPAKSRA